MRMFKKSDNYIPRRNERVTVVDNETGEEVSGIIKAYTPEKIVLEVEIDAKKVHFKS